MMYWTPSSMEIASALMPDTSLVLCLHVCVGGDAVHSALVSAGNVSVPTLPVGALPPAQLAAFDQLPVPGAAPPLHVKSVSADVAGATTNAIPSTPRTTTMRFTRDTTQGRLRAQS